MNKLELAWQAHIVPAGGESMRETFLAGYSAATRLPSARELSIACRIKTLELSPDECAVVLAAIRRLRRKA